MKSSINFINGDHNIGFIKKILYTFFFIIEFFYEKKQKKISKFKFNERDLNKFYGKKNISIKKFRSPARLCSDAYFLYFIKKFHKKKKLSVLDIGCGDGNYSGYIKNFFPQKKINYVGLDMKKNKKWEKFLKKTNNFYEINFKKDNINMLKKLKNMHGNFDIIFSTSVLEHIEHDLSLIQQISKVFKHSKNIHLVPSAVSFLNYRRHGIRRYTNKNFDLFKKYIDQKISIFPIGNNLTLKCYYMYYRYYKKKEHPFEKFINMSSTNNYRLSDILFSKKNNYPIFYAIEF